MPESEQLTFSSIEDQLYVPDKKDILECLNEYPKLKKRLKDIEEAAITYAIAYDTCAFGEVHEAYTALMRLIGVDKIIIIME